MEFLLKNLLMMTSVLVLGQAAQAAISNAWIWDQNQGPLTAANCQERSEANTPFRVKPMGHSTDAASGQPQALLLTPSDVKGLSAKASSTLKEIADYVFMLPPDAPKAKFGAGEISLGSSFWQAAEGHDGYVILSCGTGKTKIDYVAFDVFVNGSATPVARIGVNPAKPTIFSDVSVMTPDEAEAAAVQVATGNSAAKTKPSGASTSKTSSSKTSANPAAKASKDLSADSSASAPSSAPKKAASPSTKPVSTNPTKSPSRSSQTKSSTTAAAAPQLAPNPTDDQGDDSDLENLSDVPVIGGPLAYIICSLENSVKVMDQSLNNVLFDASDLEETRPMQSFDASSPTRLKAKNHHTYVKVKFPTRDSGENTGWVDESDVKLRSNCPYLEKRSLAPVPLPEARTSCCNFPNSNHPVASYREGGRRFRAARSKDRLHAACDLYRPNGEAISAVANGRVVRGKYYFYQGVYALEVVHAGGFVVRYGEILGKQAPRMEEGATVKMGQTVGYVGTVNSGCCKPMLHFELYKGTASGALTERWQHGFQRRSDLLDPTPYLADWEKRKFGSSY